MTNKRVEAWAPWVLLVFFIALWQLLCSVFEVSEFVFPSPARIWTQFWEFKGIIAG
ncbi:MAG: ABC transporter permease, partial [Betaproteobacteria bacterium]|nr:ABC transporter permease [Betaproteobacteria bacterium]